MNACEECGSYAINAPLHRPAENMNLCDVCYWKDRALRAEAEKESGWHLAGDAASGLRVLCDGDLGHEAQQIREERDSLRKALTPSAGTKAAYIGEFSFPVKGFEHPVSVPWTTIKDIMKAIMAHAKDRP